MKFFCINKEKKKHLDLYNFLKNGIFSTQSSIIIKKILIINDYNNVNSDLILYNNLLGLFQFHVKN